MNPPRPTRTAKSLRLGPEEIALLEQLLIAMPHYATEAELLAEAARRGLLLLAAEAPTTGGTIAGLGVDVLAQRIRAATLPAIDLLIRSGTVPAILGMSQTAQPVAPPAPAPPPPPSISATVASDLAGLGSGFLDDDLDDDELEITGYDV